MSPTNKQLLQNVRFVGKYRCPVCPLLKLFCFRPRSASTRWCLPPRSSTVSTVTTSVRPASGSPLKLFKSRDKNIEIQTRLGLNPLLCPKCRKKITGRASDMENFLKVVFVPNLSLYRPSQWAIARMGGILN